MRRRYFVTTTECHWNTVGIWVGQVGQFPHRKQVAAGVFCKHYNAGLRRLSGGTPGLRSCQRVLRNSERISLPPRKPNGARPCADFGVLWRPFFVYLSFVSALGLRLRSLPFLFAVFRYQPTMPFALPLPSSPLAVTITIFCSQAPLAPIYITVILYYHNNPSCCRGVIQFTPNKIFFLSLHQPYFVTIITLPSIIGIHKKTRRN